MKKLFRRSLACIIAVVMIATSLPFSAITVGAATSTTPINRSYLGVYAEGTGRFKDATVTICNDSQDKNFSIGYVTFDISNLSSYGDLDGITASYSFNVALGGDREVLGLSVFYPTKNLAKFQTNGNAGTISDIWKGNDGLHKTRAKSYFGFNLIQMIQTYKGQSENVTVNITPAIIAAKRSGQSTATIAFMNTATGASGDSGGGWSDVDLSAFGSSANVTISTAETGNEITGAIKYGPVIYTYGENTQGAEYNYLKYGGNISAGDVKSATDCQTPVTLAQGVTVQSVTCIEDSGAILSIENGLLKGKFSCIYDGMVVTLKTKLTYNGKTYIAYNKVYVDTIPVPAHAASMSQRYYGWNNPLKSIMAYSQTLKGSTGQNSTDGSSDGGQLKVNAKELYEPLTVTVRYDNQNDTNTWRLNSGIEGVLCDKFAGVTGYKISGGNSKGTTTLTTVAPTGYYYYDKSTTDNYGFSRQNGNTFSFQLVTLPFKIVTGDNASQGNVNLDTHTLTGDNFTQSDSYTTFSYDYNTGVPSISKFTNTITGDASSITNGVMSGTYELRFANGANNNVWAVNITKTNWNVYVADKSAARTPYNTVNSKVLTSENISSTSWSDYRNAYLNDEAFLASYKNVADSNVQTKSTSYGTSLTSAYNNLEYNYVFKRIGGTASVTIPAKTYSEARTATAAYFFDPSSPTKKTSDGAGNHTWTTYAWPDTVADGVYEIVEVATPHSEKCTNDGTGHCQYCRHVLIDTSTLESAKTSAKKILDEGNDDGKYVKDTYQNLSAVYDSIKNVDPTSQKHADSLAAELLTAISSLISSSVTITFTKSQNKTQVGETQTITKKYGDTAELTVSDADVEKWEIVNNKGAENEVRTFVKTGQNTLSIVVSKDISVIAHLAVNSTTQPNITKVVFMGRNNNLVAIKYIGAGDHLPTSDVAVPAIPFYKDGVWDKTEVVGLENGGEITVRAQYNFNVADADAHKCGIHFVNFVDGVRNYNYDSFVKLNDDKHTYYGMYSESVDGLTSEEAKTKFLTYFKTDEFYAPHNRDIYVYALDSAPTTASVGVTGSYHVSDDTNNVAAFNCKFFVPEGATVAEWGIKATANGKVYNFKSNNKTSRNEYTFKVNVAKVTGIGSVLAKAYIIYFDANGDRITLLSNNEVAVNFN